MLTPYGFAGALEKFVVQCQYLAIQPIELIFLLTLLEDRLGCDIEVAKLVKLSNYIKRKN